MQSVNFKNADVFSGKEMAIFLKFFVEYYKIIHGNNNIYYLFNLFITLKDEELNF